jgi:hypothetical protein
MAGHPDDHGQIAGYGSCLHDTYNAPRLVEIGFCYLKFVISFKDENVLITQKAV